MNRPLDAAHCNWSGNNRDLNPSFILSLSECKNILLSLLPPNMHSTLKVLRTHHKANSLSHSLSFSVNVALVCQFLEWLPAVVSIFRISYTAVPPGTPTLVKAEQPPGTPTLLQAFVTQTSTGRWRNNVPKCNDVALWCAVYWWLVESHLGGCFCHFAGKWRVPTNYILSVWVQFE